MWAAQLTFSVHSSLTKRHTMGVSAARLAVILSSRGCQQQQQQQQQLCQMGDVACMQLQLGCYLCLGALQPALLLWLLHQETAPVTAAKPAVSNGCCHILTAASALLAYP
jgi:hypothetical protein